MTGRTRSWLGLAAIVAAHLIVSLVHGAAHTGAHVPLSRLGNLFVFIVILGGPVAGLALAWRAERPGAWIVALAMAGALVFGTVNHFVLAGPDRVSEVDAAWRQAFTVTAVLLAATELLGFGLAIRVVRRHAA